MKHLDKIIFFVLLALTIWYGVAQGRGLHALGVRQDSRLREARDTEKLVDTVVIAPPKEDSLDYADVPKRQWEDLPEKVPPLTARTFYPRGRVRPSTHY